jgi:hypothetical protein
MSQQAFLRVARSKEKSPEINGRRAHVEGKKAV